MKSIFKLICNKRNLQEFHVKNFMHEINCFPLFFFFFFLLSFLSMYVHKMHESILSCSTAFRVILWFVQSTKLVQLHSVPHSIELCEWCTILFCRNLPIFLWPQVLHLDNSQFTNSKPLLYSTCTCKGWKETAITHWVSSQKHCTRKCIP